MSDERVVQAWRRLAMAWAVKHDIDLHVADHVDRREPDCDGDFEVAERASVAVDRALRDLGYKDQGAFVEAAKAFAKE